MKNLFLIIFCFHLSNLFGGIITQPLSKTECSGKTVILNFKDTVSGSKTYAWQRKINGKWQTINKGAFSGFNNDTLTITPAMDSLNNSIFRCVISNAASKSFFTDSAILRILSNSSSASSISGATNICIGNSNTLNIVDGTLGSNASWKWYRDSCNGTYLGAGSSFVVNPLRTTEYFVKAEGTCNTTLCKSIKVTFQDSSIPAISINGTNTLCLGTSSTLTINGGKLGTNASWKWYSGSCGGSNIGSGASLAIKPTATTTYFVRAEGICNNTVCKSFIVTVRDTSVPVSTINGNITICLGKSTTLTGNGGSLGVGASWKWYSTSCGGSILSNGLSISVAPNANTTYYLRAEGTCNTTVCGSVIVSIQDTSIPAISINGTNTICLGTSSTLTVNGGKLGTNASWKWYSGACGGSNIGSGASLAIKPTATTTYFVRAEGICNNTVCKNITVTVLDTSIPAVRITGSSEICKSQNSTLSVSGGSLGNLASWKWYENTCGGIPIATGNSVVVSPSNSGTYNYYLRAEGTCNNTTCSSFTLTVRDSSKAATAINGVTTICNGAATTLNLTGGSLGSGGSWKWYSNACGGAFLGSGTSISLNPSTNTTYFVRAEGTCNQTPCVNTTIIVQDSSEPALGINGNNTICVGQKTTLNVIGGKLGVNADWKWYTGACGSMIMGSGANLTVAPTKTTTYYLRAEGTCNKTKCISFIVTVQDTSMPAITISGNKSICLGQNTTLTLNGGSLGAGANWRWYSNSCGETSVGNGLSVKVNPTTTTTYYLRAEGFCNQTNCLTTNVLVQDSSIPANTINGVNNICIGQSTTLSLDGGKLGYLAEWNWYADDCGGKRIGKGTNIKVMPNTTTKFFLRAESVCNNTVCRTITVIVNETPKLTAYNDTICFGEIAKPYVSGGVAYEWTPQNGIDNPNSNKPSILYTSPISVRNNFPYIVKVIDWNRCVDSVTVMVVVNPLPSVDAGQDVGICPTDRTLLRASGANAYTWSPSVEFRTFNKDTASVSPKLNTLFKVAGTDNNGCRNTDSVLVKVYPRADARAGEDDSICFGKSSTLLGSGGKEYLWTGTNLTNPNSSNPTILPSNSTSYILRVIDDNGCRSFDTVNIAVINNPTPTITGKFNVCKNERGTEFYTNRTANKFDWKIQNGKIQHGNGSNLILAHWNTSSDTLGNVELTETLIQYPFCPVTVSKTVKIGGTISPTPPELVFKANNVETKILICPNCEFEKYQWGYENKSNRAEIFTCKDIIWCKFDKIDTAKNYYWVKVGADLSCQTKTYFTPPNYLNVELKNHDESITLYPNPTSTSFTVESVSKVSKILIFNSVGEQVEDVTLDDSTVNKYTINTTTYARGLYFVCVFDNSGRTIKKLVLN